MKYTSVKILINAIFIFFLISFLVFSINLYLQNKHVNTQTLNNNISIIQISILSKKKGLVDTLGSLLSERMLRGMLYDKIKVSSLHIGEPEKMSGNYNDVQIYNIKMLATVRSEENEDFYQKFENEKKITKGVLLKIFEDRTKKLENYNDQLKTETINNIFSRDDLKKMNEFRVITNNQLYNKCEFFKISDKFVMQSKNLKIEEYETFINYSISCISLDKVSDIDKFDLDISITPYYEDTYNDSKLNTVYLIYVILVFLIGIFLILFNFSSISQKININN